MNRTAILILAAFAAGAILIFGMGVKAGRGSISTVWIYNDSKQEISSGKLIYEQGMILFDAIRPDQRREVKLHLDKEAQVRTVLYYHGGPVIESAESKLKPGRTLKQISDSREIRIK